MCETATGTGDLSTASKINQELTKGLEKKIEKNKKKI